MLVKIIVFLHLSYLWKIFLIYFHANEHPKSNKYNYTKLVSIFSYGEYACYTFMVLSNIQLPFFLNHSKNSTFPKFSDEILNFKNTQIYFSQAWKHTIFNGLFTDMRTLFTTITLVSRLSRMRVQIQEN